MRLALSRSIDRNRFRTTIRGEADCPAFLWGPTFCADPNDTVGFVGLCDHIHIRLLGRIENTFFGCDHREPLTTFAM